MKMKFMKLPLIVCCLFCSLGIFVKGYSQSTIVAWQAAASIEGSHPSTTNNSNLETAVLSRGPALGYNNSSTFTYTSLWPAGQNKEQAKSTGAYYQVVIQAKPGYFVSLSTLDARVRRNTAAAVSTYRWAYSLNGTDFFDIGTADVLMTRTAADDTNGDVQATIDLSGVPDLQYVPSTTIVTLRMYAWGATSATANFGIGKSTFSGSSVNTLTFGGSVTNVLPSPVVHFVTNGGTAIADVNPPYNSTITAPQPPTRTGYTFDGWYKEATFTTLWDFATDVVRFPVYLYAKWNPLLYTINFNADGGTAVSAVQAYHDQLITEPVVPTKAGFGFGGWYKEAALTNRWNFSTDVATGNITLYAKWNNPNQTITFPAVAEKTYGDAPFVLNATANSDLEVVYEALTPNISINGNTVTILSAGNATVRATQAGDSFYLAAPAVEISFNIKKASQSLTFAQVGPYSRYIGSVQLNASSSSGLPILFTASEPTIAQIEGATMQVKGLGKVKVTAKQEGNENYLAATEITQTIVIHTGGPLQLLINQALSPNGDGINDVLIIEGIKSFAENKVKIMNRSGAEVYSKTGYDNETIVFSGRNSSGEKLPEGTYYYYVQVKQGERWADKKGYFILKYQ